jgi:sigma-B regulation protein RsbU (phosphoserine phosphatase)
MRYDDPHDDGPRTLLTGRSGEDEERVQRLLRTIAEVNSNRDLDSVLVSVVDRALSTTKAERAILMLVEGGKLRHRVARNYKGRDLAEDVSYSRTVPVEVARSGEARILRNTAAEDLADLGTSIISLRLLTVMCVPLRYKGRVTGVIYVDSKATSMEFQSSDLVLLNALADQAAIAIENARLLEVALQQERTQHELRIAQRIQAQLLPVGPLRAEGFDLFGISVPCDETGGDYFDFLPERDGTLRVAVGDVAGHGVPAALIMSSARASLRAVSPHQPDLAVCLSNVNEHLERDLEPGQYMTMFAAELLPGSRSFRYVCAGHPPPLVVRTDGTLEWLERTGMGLGIEAGASFRCGGPVELAPGDVLFAFTDGITEASPAPEGAKERDLFETDRLASLLVEIRERSAREIANGVREAIGSWRRGAPRDDDETMVVVKSE